MPKHLIAIEKVDALPADASLYQDGYPVRLSTDGLIYLADPATPGWDPAGVAGQEPDAITVAASGAAPSLDLTLGSGFDVTLDQAATFAFTGAVAGKVYSFKLVLRQNATGGWAASFPSNVRWAGGAAPTLTTTANAIDLLEFFTFDGGATWFGHVRDLDVAEVPEPFSVASPTFVTGQELFENGAQGIHFTDDGLMLFVVNRGSDTVIRYDLSTAWDLTTAVANANTLAVGTQDTDPRGLHFSPDGTKLYVVGDVSDDVFRYNLTTAWDLSTGTFLNSVDVGVQDTNPQGVRFSADGLKMFIVGATNDSVYQRPLTTAWDLTTVGAATSFSVATELTAPWGVSFSPDGTKMFLAGSGNPSLYRYDLSTAWDVTTAVLAETSPDLSLQVANLAPTEVVFEPNGMFMFVIDAFNAEIVKFEI